MNEKTIVSTATLVTSLLAYWYAKGVNKDVVPYLLIGGFVGSVIGETIAEKVKKSNNNLN
jgi:uncharacterized membrane protein YfcA